MELTHAEVTKPLRVGTHRLKVGIVAHPGEIGHRPPNRTCTRPSLVAEFLHGRREPDLDGWPAYTASGQFGGDLSSIRGSG
jgi:hypothetical protein